MSRPNADTLLNRMVTKAKFRHLKVLIKLAEMGSMRKTADVINMTQPAISQVISELENLLEMELFFRHSKGVAPTEITRELLPVAHRILEALEDGAELVANRLNERAGIVRVSASYAAIGGILHSTLAAFAEAYPDIQVQISEASGADPLAAIVDGSADLVFTRQPSVVPEGWHFEPCLTDKLLVVCGRQHELATLPHVQLEVLASQNWLLNRIGSIARKRFEEVALTNGWASLSRSNLIMQIPELTREMLLSGKYLAIIPRSVSQPWLLNGDVIALNTEMDLDLPPLGVLERVQSEAGATARFVKFLRQAEFSKIGPEK